MAGPADIERVLLSRFGFSSLRSGQGEIIGDVLAGRPTVAIMPTGAGKSLCYQLPAVVLGETGQVTVVVSPLIALMKDQVDGLRALGIDTAALTSAASYSEQSEILAGMAEGAYDLIFVAPERFQSDRFGDSLALLGDRLGLLAIDEAHCISEWGHDFRPAYRMLGEVIQTLRPPRILALTATATSEVQADIASQLGLRDPALHVHGFGRPNLRLRVVHAGGVADKSKRAVERVRGRSSGTAIVYAATRKNCERYAAALEEAGMRVGVYHAGLADETRRAAQDAFMNDGLDAIVATNAFGMGVDKTDIRVVVHADIPRSVEAYYQEAGRAGRDGLPAECVLLFNHGDVRTHEFLIDAANPSAEVLRGLWKLVRAEPELTTPEAFGKRLPSSPHASVVQGALRLLGRHGFVVEGRDGWRATRPETLGGEFPVFDPEASERRAATETGKLRSMIDYAYHTGCRHGYLVDYFGDSDARPSECRGCDNCRGEGGAREVAAGELEACLSLLALVHSLSGRLGRTRLAAIAGGDDEDGRFAEVPELGCLRSRSKKEILDLLGALEGAGLVEQSRGEYPTMVLGRRGKRITEGRETLDPSDLRIRERSSPRRRSRVEPVTGKAMAGDIDTELVERLRELRSRLASDRSVPAYVIFSNRTLEELARAKPRTEGELLGVPGIGPSRLEEFGGDILAALSRP